MMDIRIVHGFNTMDGGKKSVGPLESGYGALGYSAEIYRWGASNIFNVRLLTSGAIDGLIEEQRNNPARVWVGHSHGAYICCAAHKALPDDVQPPEALVLIQSAMHTDAALPPLPIVVRYNHGDWATWWGERWRRWNPVSWVCRHPWGAAGTYGFDDPHDLVIQVDTDSPRHGEHRIKGHSAHGGHADYWATYDLRRIGLRVDLG